MKTKIIKVEELPTIIKQVVENQQLTKMSTISKRIISSLKIENNKFLTAINQLPIIRHALRFEKGFTAVIPENLKEGIKKGTLKIMQGKDGNLISTIVDSSTGKIVHQMRLTEFTKMVNPTELSQAMNQICMQMQLEEIQKNLIEFRIETNQKLNEIIKNFHEDRVIPSDAVKLSFLRYQKGEEISKSQLLVEIDRAKASLLRDVKVQIASIKRFKSEISINAEQSKELQNKIGFILESINNLQDLFFIDCYLYKDDEKKCSELTSEYIEELIKVLSLENIKLLDNYSDFSYLGLNYNIWEKKITPLINNLINENMKKSKFVLEKK